MTFEHSIVEKICQVRNFALITFQHKLAKQSQFSIKISFSIINTLGFELCFTNFIQTFKHSNSLENETLSC